MITPTKLHTFDIVSRYDPAILPENFDGFDALRIPDLPPDGIEPEVWRAFCESEEIPETASESLWRQYMRTGDHACLATTGAPLVYTCRPLCDDERHWCFSHGYGQSRDDSMSLHRAVVALALTAISGPRDVPAARLAKERTRMGVYLTISWDSLLWRDAELWPSGFLTFNSLAGQIVHRSALPEAAVTFR